MVGSVDGRASSSGRASGIGGSADRAAMRALRSRVDAVMVGAGTLRAEKLKLGVDDPSDRQPLGVVVVGAGHAPVSEHLLDAPGRVLLAVPEGSEAGRWSGEPDVLEVPSENPGFVDLTKLLETLRVDHGVERLLVEGGPGLNRSLIASGLADEIFLTVAPKLLGGPEAAIVAGGQTNSARDLELISVHRADDELFLRYRLQKPARSTPPRH